MIESQGFDCPDESSESTEKYFPDPDGVCNNFYWMCVFGSAVKMDCNPGTFFSPETLTCAWPADLPECVSSDSS